MAVASTTSKTFRNLRGSERYNAELNTQLKKACIALIERLLRNLISVLTKSQFFMPILLSLYRSNVKQWLPVA